MTKVAVGFDFDHTLGLDNGLERHAFGRLAAQFGVDLNVDIAPMRDVLETLMAPFRAAEEPMSMMMARFVGSLPPKAHVLDLDTEHLAGRYRQICYDLVDELVKPMPGALACIQALVAGGVEVAILTNGWSELQERKIAHALGDFPGPILVSETLGVYKPSAAAFRSLETTLGVTPAELWYVGDNPVADIAGARAYGLRAVWFNQAGHAYPAELAAPTAEIEHLDALAAVVRGA